MRKKVLAKLTKKEIEQLDSLNSLIATLRSLLQNRYIDVADKQELTEQLSQKEKVRNVYMINLFKKYGIPTSASNVSMISYDNGEIFIKV